MSAGPFTGNADAPGVAAGAVEQPQAPAEVADIGALTPQALEAHMRWAMYQGSVLAAQATVPREFQETADGILKLAQATVIMDPKLVAPQGVPPDALSPPRPRIPMDKSAPSGRNAITG